MGDRICTLVFESCGKGWATSEHCLLLDNPMASLLRLEHPRYEIEHQDRVTGCTSTRVAVIHPHSISQQDKRPAHDLTTRPREFASGKIATHRCIVPRPPSSGSLAGRQSQAASLDEIKKRGYMIVATEDDFKPFEFVQDGKPTGFDNELLAILSEIRSVRSSPGDHSLDRAAGGREHGQVRHGAHCGPDHERAFAVARTSRCRSPMPRTITSSARATTASRRSRTSTARRSAVQAGSGLAATASPNSRRCWRRPAERSARSSSTPPTRRRIRISPSAAPTSSSTR